MYFSLLFISYFNIKKDNKINNKKDNKKKIRKNNNKNNKKIIKKIINNINIFKYLRYFLILYN